MSLYESFLAHIGVGHLDGGHSGRFPYGSGDNPYQHMAMHPLRVQVKDLREKGYTESEIAAELGYNTAQLRAKISMAKAEELERNRTYILKQHDKGYSNSEIARRMGISEGSVRNYLKPVDEMRTDKIQNVANELRKQVDDKRYLDIGAGVERQLGVSDTKLKAAVAMLEEQGYKKSKIKVPQVTNPGKYTWVKVLTKDDVSYKELNDNWDKIMAPKGVYFEDNGLTARGIEPPVSIDSKRIKINYAEDGGTKKDGVIEIRPGVQDISLGRNNYAQVRIAVDGTHYLKGMAMYNDDLPKGVDIVFNTNKHAGTPMTGPKDNTVLKPMDSDPDNPFGSTVRQWRYTDKEGKEHLSPINIVNDDSDWGHWSRNLASQFLSKQYAPTAKRQLDLAYKAKEQEYKDICALDNPAVKKRLLASFSDDCDAAAVNLKAAPLPGQRTHVILPLTEIKDNEVYAPNYKNGEEVILVRYPHGGIFEIPRLKVNNNNKQGKKLLGQTENAIGINSTVAEQLSGADFDGDTVIVIPTKNQNLKTSKQLEGLKDFDPKEQYRAYKGMPEVGAKTDGFHKQTEMGKISNLITDMTIKGAEPPEIARAVRHSMVVIDAEKHNLDWRRSYEDNRIAQLKEKYQGGANKGASTLISRAKSTEMVNQRKDIILEKDVDKETGEKIFRETGEFYIKERTLKNGTVKRDKIFYKQESTKMAEKKDARELSSGTRIENIYALHANRLKALANESRKEYLATPSQRYDPEARKRYSVEVASLDTKLNVSLQNAPKERQAQLIANSIVNAKKRDNPDMDKDEIKKLKAQALESARSKTGAARYSNTPEGKKRDNPRMIEITPREWEAIQAGAISQNKLSKILNNTDLDVIKEYATPRDKRTIPPATKSRAIAMLNAGYTQKEIAEACGISVSSVRELMN